MFESFRVLVFQNRMVSGLRVWVRRVRNSELLFQAFFQGYSALGPQKHRSLENTSSYRERRTPKKALHCTIILKLA